MPTHSMPKLLWPVLVLAALLAFPVMANATLTYVRNPINPQVFVANDDGSAARKIGSGSNPRVLPDGSVVYLQEGSRKYPAKMRIVPGDGGAERTLMTFWREPSVFAVSPDSTMIAALRGGEIGKRTLVFLNVATGEQRGVARGYFGGVSFSPDGSQIVYSRAAEDDYPPRSDIFRFEVPIPGVVHVRAPEPVRLTSDRRSSSPLWGPDKIVFVKTVDGKKRKYGPKNELFLMNPEGKQVKRLTSTKVSPLLQGLFPTDWSADGNRLLTEFQGQDTSYAVVVNPKTGKQRPVAEQGESGFVGTALSSDGTLVLGSTGGFDPSNKHNVVTVPYAGGKPKILVKNAFEPDWSR